MHLQDNGATVTAADDADRAAFRRSRGIPDSAASCHTGIVGDYAIEGHVPASAIAVLLSQQPAATGLALPGMPADSPGMGGDEAAWSRQPVLLVGTDGSTTPFAY